MRSVIFITACICLLHPLFGQNAEKHYQQSLLKIKDKGYTEALTLIDKAIAENPDSAKYFYTRAIICSALGMWQQFYKDVDHAIYLKKDYAEAYLLRAGILKDAGQFYDAIKDANMAIMLAPNDSIKYWSYCARGNAKWSMNKPQEAYEDYLECLKIDSLDPAAYLGIGNCLDDMGKPAEAIQFLLKAFALDTTTLGPLISVSYQLGVMGDHSAAITYATRVIDKDPGVKSKSYAYNNRGYSKMKLGDYKGAREDINKSIKLNPYNPYAYRNRALVYIELKKYKRACKDLDKALELGFTVRYGNEVIELQNKYCR